MHVYMKCIIIILAENNKHDIILSNENKVKKKIKYSIY